MKLPTPKKCYSEQVRATWQKRRERGDSCAAIGKDYGLSAHVIRINTDLPRAVVTDVMVSKWQERRDAGERVRGIAESDGVSAQTVWRFTELKAVPDNAVPMSLMVKVKDFTKEFPITVNGVVVGYFKPKGDDNEL